LGLQAEDCNSGLQIGDPTHRRQPAARALALAPALVVEGQHHAAGLVLHSGIVAQVEVLDAGIAVREHDAAAALAGSQVIGQEEVAIELEALAVERDRSAHGSLARFPGLDRSS